MPRIPNSKPIDSPRCDPRLPYAALRYRIAGSPQLISQASLGTTNITAWPYRDKRGVEGIQVNPNVTIAELILTFGSAPTPDAEVGFHSECLAAEWFRGTAGPTSTPNLQRAYPLPPDVLSYVATLLSRSALVLLLRRQFMGRESRRTV